MQASKHPLKNLSWGRVFEGSQEVLQTHWKEELLDSILASKNLLAHGMGRSYGDVALNSAGQLILCKNLDRILAFDPATGILKAEAGFSFEQVIEFALPRGFFPPVSPGTRFVTLGGAVANDVHGKNHHRSGTFGHHLISLDLLRSDGKVYHCSQNENPELFRASIGGLGLTGIILNIEFQLKRVKGPYISSQEIKVQNLANFFSLAEESDRDFEYTVCWIDTLAKGKDLGRGIFIRGNHSDRKSRHPIRFKTRMSLPFDFPGWVLNQTHLKIFNELFYRKNWKVSQSREVYFEPFFYPLDKILNWNRAYGKKGFFQYQFVLPLTAKERMLEILERISLSKQGSFLSVLKFFGNMPPRGLLSFAKPGLSLALDLPNLGQKTLDLLDSLDEVVVSAGGKIYLAKDARMSAEVFKKTHPELNEFSKWKDPALESDLWRRLQ